MAGITMEGFDNVLLLATAAAAIIGIWPVVGPWIKRSWYAYKIRSKLCRLKIEEQGELLDEYEWLCEKALKHNLKELHDECKEKLIRVEILLRKKVRVFFLIGDRQQRNRLATAILRQNQIQTMFQFEIGCLGKKINKRFESKFNEALSQCENISDESLLSFIEQYKKLIYDTELRETQDESSGLVRIVVTDQGMPKKYYLWGHFDTDEDGEESSNVNKFWVASLAALEQYYEGQQITMEQSLLRIIQRASILSIVPRLEHKSTYGCLFDNSWLLVDTQYFIKNFFICNQCKVDLLKTSKIPAGHRSGFLDGIQCWLKDSTDDVSHTASTDYP